MDNNILDFYRTVLPYGSYDLNTAINIALEVGEDGTFLGECINDYIYEMDIKISDIDVVACIYETILHNYVREEIIDTLEIDVLDYDVYVSGNYIGTSFDKYESLAKSIEGNLKEIGNSVEFSKKVIWFFNQIDITL